MNIRAVNIRAKFNCVGVTKRKGWGGVPFVYDAELSAVTDNVRETSGEQSEVDENRSFFAATPAGTVRLSTLRADLFNVGEAYYVDFTKVDL